MFYTRIRSKDLMDIHFAYHRIFVLNFFNLNFSMVNLFKGFLWVTLRNGVFYSPVFLADLTLLSSILR